MALAKTNITEYMSGADFDPDYETIREAAMNVLAGSEPVVELAIPAALSAAVGTVPDLMVLLWAMAIGVSDETSALGVLVYAAKVAGTPKLFARQVST